MSVPDDDVMEEGPDNYIGAEVTLPFGGTSLSGRVCKHARDESGETFGKAHTDPILDTSEFPDGQKAEYAANVIAENMFAMCDPGGNQHCLRL